MKKVYSFRIIFLLAGLLLQGVVAPAQYISLDVGGEMQISAPANTPRIDSHLNIANSANFPVSIKVNRDMSQMVYGHQNAFCWFQCYDSTVSISPDALDMDPRSTDSIHFHSYVYPNSIPGIDYVTYFFYDLNYPSDTMTVTITYQFSSVGIDEIGKSKGTLAVPSPNPANNLTSISYSLNNPKDATLTIYNLLGKSIREIKLTEKQSTMIVSTVDLPSGVYLCSLHNGGSMIATKKLIVAHR